MYLTIMALADRVAEGIRNDVGPMFPSGFSLGSIGRGDRSANARP